MMELHYAAPAEDVRDIVSIYYYGEFSPSPVVATERAAIAQIRFPLAGSCITTTPVGDRHCIKNSSIFGPTRGETHYEFPEGGRFVGAGLLPCGLHALIGGSAAALVDQIFDFPQQHEEQLRALEQALRAAPDFAAMVLLLDDAAKSLDALVDPQVRIFVQTVDAWLLCSIDPDVSDLYNRMNLSSRQVERLVKNLYGVSPKFLARKYRALRAARMLGDEGGLQEGEEPADAFYDQSHFIREIKRFTGQTPSEIRLHADELNSIINSRSDLTGQIHPLVSKS